MEGENERYASADVFWVLFDPRLPPAEVVRRAKAIYGRDPKPLGYGYDDETGVYADSHATGELIQAIGRARLVRREGVQVVIMTGRELPGISGRSETTLFDLEDLITAGGLSKLKDSVRQRLVQERELHQTVKTPIEDGASDNKICQTLGIHSRLAKEIRATLPSRVRARTFREGMSPNPPSTISISIEGGGDVTKDIRAVISAGVSDIKGIRSHLNLKPDAIKQRLSRLVKSGELIRTARGRYGLPNANCDFLHEEVSSDV